MLKLDTIKFLSLVLIGLELILAQKTKTLLRELLKVMLTFKYRLVNRLCGQQVDDKLDLMTTSKTSEFGTLAERYASDFLKARNYAVLALNYQKPWGEIDIIAEKEGILVFVEVKANSKEITGFEPELRVNREKLKRIVRAARTYLADKKYGPDQAWQIDILSLTLDKTRQVAKIKHFKNIEA